MSKREYYYRVSLPMRLVILIPLLVFAAGSLGLLGDRFVINKDYQRVIPSCMFVAFLLISILVPYKGRYIALMEDELMIPSLFIGSRHTIIKFEDITQIREQFAGTSKDVEFRPNMDIDITLGNGRRIRIKKIFFERAGYETFVSHLRERISEDSSLKCTTTFFQRDDA